MFKDGQRFELPPISNPREVDFGEGVGRKGTYLYNLPEVASSFKYLKVGFPHRGGRFPVF